jgi:hypothetical protein
MAIRRSEMREKVANAPRPGPRIEQTHSSDPSPFSGSPESQSPSPEQVAIAAYYRAAARGFEPGHETEDWLEAEQELRSQTTGERETGH